MRSSPKPTPAASAILAVYNAQATVTACLKSLLTQSIPIEIIIIDDGSTDHTLKLLRQFPHLKILKQSHQGPANARNLGSTHAKGKILLFVDADMTFDKNYVRDLTIPIIAGQVIGTYTKEERVANWDNPWARCWNVEEGWAPRKRFPVNPPKYGTDFRAILKSEFEKVGGFDNIGYTDTWSLFHKLGVRPLVTRAVCYHHNPNTLSAVFRQARWLAKRPYKFGVLGTTYALLRTSLPASLVVGTAQSLWFRLPQFFVFKLVYDLGRFVGVCEMQITGKLSK